MQSRYAELRSWGGEVLAVSFSKPERVAAYLRVHPLPFPAVADPAREGYRAFELGRTSWGSFFRPRVLGRYLQRWWQGWRLESPAPHEDLLQLGGDLVLDRNLRVVYAYRSTEPTDRPALDLLLQVMRSAASAER